MGKCRTYSAALDYWCARRESCKYHGQRRHTGCLCRRFSTAMSNRAGKDTHAASPRDPAPPGPRLTERNLPTSQTHRNTGTGWQSCLQDKKQWHSVPFPWLQLHVQQVPCLSVCQPVADHTSLWPVGEVYCTCQKPRHQPTVAPKNSAVRTMMKRPITPATNPPESRPAPGKLAA